MRPERMSSSEIKLPIKTGPKLKSLTDTDGGIQLFFMNTWSFPIKPGRDHLTPVDRGHIRTRGWYPPLGGKYPPPPLIRAQGVISPPIHRFDWKRGGYHYPFNTLILYIVPAQSSWHLILKSVKLKAHFSWLFSSLFPTPFGHFHFHPFCGTGFCPHLGTVPYYILILPFSSFSFLPVLSQD